MVRASGAGWAWGDMPSLPRQATLSHAISCVGRGLHTGLPVRLTLLPGDANTGIVFERTDVQETVSARWDRVSDTRLSTVIGPADAPMRRVATIEHLMAAFSGLEIDNARVQLDGPELPILDGSSDGFAFLISCAGRTEQAAPARVIEVLRRVRVEQGDAFAELRPGRRGLSLSLSIDFPGTAIGRQSMAMRLSPATFQERLSRARTFVLRRDIEALQRAGLALGGSLDCAIVVDDETVLNPGGLRAPDEFVRHKVLDAVGDLSLAGGRLRAGFIGHKSGHGLNNAVLRALFADERNWRFVGAAKAAPVLAMEAA